MGMAYEVTATRRRPQRFEDMIGQEFVVATLQKSLVSGKIAHAYLFSGPRGCGKTSSARILAKTLNCEEGPGKGPCGKCAACVEIARGSSLDVIEIDGASNTSVNDVRQIKEEVLFPPNALRYKVYIIDEVHMLSTSAFNALLKTIEEPPPYVVFIFATTELHKIPATIKSRCQQFNFRLVSVERLKEALADAARESGISAEDEALFWIAREATGSVRDAYTLFDQVAAFSDSCITFDKIRDKLGLVGIDRLNPIVELCADNKPGEALMALDAVLQANVSIEQFVVDAADYFRSLLFVKSGITKDTILGQNPSRFSQRVLEAWSSIDIERALALTLQTYRDIRYSLDPRFELELTLSRLSWTKDYVSPAEMKRAIFEAKNALGGGANGPFPQADREREQPVQDTVREDEEEPLIREPFAAFKEKINARQDGSPLVERDQPPKQETPLSREQPPRQEPLPEQEPRFEEESIPFERLQEKVVDFFKSTKNMLATGLAQATNWELSGSTVFFTVTKPFVHNFLMQDQKTIAAAVSQLLARPVGIHIRLEDLSAAKDADDDDGVIPAQVDMIRQMFRGTLVEEGHK